MKIVNKNDKILLEGLEEKYGKEMLAKIISAMAAGNQVPVEEADTEEKAVPAEDNVLKYIMYLEGVRIRLRELHWQAEKHSEHILTDDIIGKLESTEDAIAENLMGICGFRIKVGQICPIMTEQTDLKSVLVEIAERTLELEASLEYDKTFTGISNILEDLSDFLNKSKYLETLK
jgi:hypothetical protein